MHSFGKTAEAFKDVRNAVRGDRCHETGLMADIGRCNRRAHDGAYRLGSDSLS